MKELTRLTCEELPRIRPSALHHKTFEKTNQHTYLIAAALRNIYDSFTAKGLNGFDHTMEDQPRAEKVQGQAYRSFMLRFWRVEGNKTRWRVSLEDPSTGQRRGFASLSKLFTFLLEEFCDEDEG